MALASTAKECHRPLSRYCHSEQATEFAGASRAHKSANLIGCNLQHLGAIGNCTTVISQLTLRSSSNCKGVTILGLRGRSRWLAAARSWGRLARSRGPREAMPAKPTRQASARAPLPLMNVVSAASVLTASARGRLPWNRPLPAETISPQCFMYTLLGYGKALAKLRPTNSKGAAAPPGSVSVAPPTQPNTSIRTRSFAPPGYSCSHWPLGHFVTFLYLELARESFRPGQ
jgi:hypothetical protein